MKKEYLRRFAIIAITAVLLLISFSSCKQEEKSLSNGNGKSKPSTYSPASTQSKPALNKLTFNERKEWVERLGLMNSWQFPNITSKEVNEEELIQYCGLYAYREAVQGNRDYEFERVYNEILNSDLPKIKSDYFDKAAQFMFERNIKEHKSTEPFLYNEGYYVLNPYSNEGFLPRVMDYSNDGEKHRFSLEYYSLPELTLHTQEGKEISLGDADFYVTFLDETIIFNEKPAFKCDLVLKEVGDINHLVVEKNIKQ